MSMFGLVAAIYPSVCLPPPTILSADALTYIVFIQNTDKIAHCFTIAVCVQFRGGQAGKQAHIVT
jgi:hypothetical protein